MMKKNIFLLCFCMSIFGVYGQKNTCETTINKAKEILFKQSPFVDQSTLVSLLEPCALQGDVVALNYLGLVYLNGIGTDINLDKAFTYISTSANKGFAKAQYNLGRLYKYGTGCDMSLSNALHWFETAAGNGNDRAAYSLGYMYYKGYGFKQDYTQAIYWFEKSEDPMAKHFLGLSYYLGHGVEENTGRALEILLNNSIVNSKVLVGYIQEEKKEAVKSTVESVLIDDSLTSVIIKDNEPETTTLEVPTESELINEWEGRLIQYDWSGDTIENIRPISVVIEKNEGILNVRFGIEGQEMECNSLWQDESLFLEKLEFSLEKLYLCDPNKKDLEYSFFSMNIKKQNFNNEIYLTGTVDSFINEWSEYGEPMSLILQPRDTKNSLTEEELLALANQEDEFIKLYPVPFKNELLIQYYLGEPANVRIELTSFDKATHLVLDEGSEQAIGEHSLYDEPQIPEGRYIIKLTVGSKAYTRIIVKEN